MNSADQISKQTDAAVDLKVLCECMPFVYDRELIKEDNRSGAKKLILRGIIQKADVINQNGRIYPFDVLKTEITNYQKFINENRAMGELDHPTTSVVELKNVSHIVREAKLGQDGIVYGAIEVLPTPAGNILRNLIESNVTVGISSRGVGSTKNESGNTIVQDDFQLICFDIVSEPSTSNAFLMRESRSLTQDELTELRRLRFTRDIRIDRIINDILRWD